MLRAAHRRFGLLQRLVKCELIGFGQCHFTIATQVASATETANKRMRKERTLEFVAFLAGFILRAARDERITFHVAALIDHKRRHGLTTFHAGNRAGTTSIYHGNLDIGIQSVNAIAQIFPGVSFAT